MTTLIIYLLLALAVSFLCSIMEAVLLSTPASFIQAKEQGGSAAASHFRKLKENIDRPLAAILSLNTFAHTLGAAGVGAQAVKLYGEAYFGIISAILTLLILVFSEILPKTIGANYWKELVLPSTSILRTMIFISYPLVVMSQFLTRIFSRNKKTINVSREEVAILATIGAQEGIFNQNESKIINNLIRLRSVKVREVMTPRTVVFAVSDRMTLGEFFKDEEHIKYSRIPVYGETIDNIKGYVLKSDVLEELAKDKHDLEMREIIREINVTYENQPLLTAFENLLRLKEHITIVVDEFGGFEGLVTLEDIVETLLGLEITDESDTQADLQQIARERWLKKAKALNIELEKHEK